MEHIEMLVERLSAEHAEGVRRLFLNEYGKCLPGFPLEKYKVGRDGEQVFAHVILHQNEVIGFYGVEVMRYQRGGSGVQVAQGCEFLVDPAWRGRGFFQLIYHKVVEQLLSHGITLMIGFQSESSRAFCLRVGWSEFGRMVRFHLKGSSRLLARIVYHLGAERWKIRRMQRVFKAHEADADWHLLNADEDRYAAVYNKTFFAYKVNGVYFTVLLEGCLLYLKYNRYLEVGYVHLHEDADVPAMLKKLRQIVRKLWVHEIVFQLSPESAVTAELEKYLEKFPSHYLGYCVLDAKSNDVPPLLKINYLEADTF